ncbi:MAG: energy transducer TonB [Bacteroidales bacterium]|nr:energy transducer TonB [Bacteroidales bacterium]
MHRGKVICKELKEVRRRIADENDIPLEIKECTYEGPCRGTCPRCEAEVRYLENALADKLRLGKVATVAGLSLGLAACGGQTVQGEAPNDDTLVPPATDTIQAADTAKPVWRAPEDSDLYVGVFEVMPLAAVPDSEAVADEGEVDDDEALFGVIAETEPEYPGGIEAMYKFVQDNLKYPQLALENGIQGRVYLTFVVEEDGSISNVRVLRDIGGGCGLEAKRVVEMMPKWKPGKQRDKVVRTQYNLPINFVRPADYQPLLEGAAPVHIYEDHSKDIRADEVVDPHAPTQQMEVEGVKVKVK